MKLIKNVTSSECMKKNPKKRMVSLESCPLRCLVKSLQDRSYFLILILQDANTKFSLSGDLYVKFPSTKWVKMNPRKRRETNEEVSILISRYFQEERKKETRHPTWKIYNDILTCLSTSCSFYHFENSLEWMGNTHI